MFGEKYGNIAVPTKCYVLPLNDIYTYSYRHWLEEHSPNVSKKFNDFLDKNPNKKITRIPINPFTNQIPEELRKVTNYKAVICFRSCTKICDNLTYRCTLLLSQTQSFRSCTKICDNLTTKMVTISKTKTSFRSCTKICDNLTQRGL